MQDWLLPINGEIQATLGLKMGEERLFRRNRHASFAMTVTASAAVPKAVSARRQARVCSWTALAQERERPSNPTPPGLEQALRTAPVQEPGTAGRPTQAEPVSEMQALVQARRPEKGRSRRPRPLVAEDPRQQTAAVPPERPLAAAEQPWRR